MAVARKVTEWLREKDALGGDQVRLSLGNGERVIVNVRFVVGVLDGVPDMEPDADVQDGDGVPVTTEGVDVRDRDRTECVGVRVLPCVGDTDGVPVRDVYVLEALRVRLAVGLTVGGAGLVETVPVPVHEARCVREGDTEKDAVREGGVAVGLCGVVALGGVRVGVGVQARRSVMDTEADAVALLGLRLVEEVRVERDALRVRVTPVGVPEGLCVPDTDVEAENGDCVVVLRRERLREDV